MQSIQKIYTTEDRIHIDVDQGRLHAFENEIRQLDSYEDYRDLLHIEECPKLRLFGYFGSGACITGIKPDNSLTERLKSDKNIKSFQDIQQIGFGTLGGFIKSENKLHGLTCQHIIEDKTAEGNMCFWAEISDDVIELKLSDVIHVGSAFGGFIGPHLVGVAEKAVDAALFTLEQVGLDESQLTQLPIATIDDLLPEGQPHECYVEKIGARTGKTQGIIIHGRTVTKLPDDNYGEMFYVAPSGKESSMIFAAEGDSGSLVTTNIKGQEFAIGMVQGGGTHSGIENVTCCVEIKYCLEALANKYKSGKLDIYKGFLRPFVGVHDRTNPHV